MAEPTRKTPRSGSILLLGCLALAPACSGFPEQIRRVTYTPEFGYISEDQIESTMWQLARQVREVDTILRRSRPVTESERAQVVALLTAMHRTTTALSTQREYTNHPLIDQHLDKFQRDLDLARRAVEAEPPSYFLAGSITGACLYCHGGKG
jgi:hypothetical protein